MSEAMSLCTVKHSLNISMFPIVNSLHGSAYYLDFIEGGKKKY